MHQQEFVNRLGVGVEEAEEEAGVRPTCFIKIGEENSWIRVPLTEELEVWRDPCGHCFPDGEVDVEEVVVKKNRCSNSGHLHKPRQ